MFELESGLGPEICRPTEDLIRASWRAMDRSPDLQYERAAELVASSQIAADSLGATDLGQFVEVMHYDMRTRFWIDDTGNYVHDQPFATLDSGMRANYLAFSFANKVATYCSLFGSDLPPKAYDINWDKLEALGLEQRYVNPERGTLERAVGLNLWSAWTNRYPHLAENPAALDWNGTLVSAIEAVCDTVYTLDQFQEPGCLKVLGERLHRHMIERKLWGEDSHAPDRAYADGRPLDFDELVVEMKENYVLLSLATIAGILDYEMCMQS